MTKSLSSGAHDDNAARFVPFTIKLVGTDEKPFIWDSEVLPGYPVYKTLDHVV